MPIFSAVLAITFLKATTADPSAQTTKIVNDYLEKQAAAGISVAVMQNGKLLYGEGFGWQDQAKQIKATADTRFRLASISKPITSTAIMKLVEDGKLNLDADIRKYVPEWPQKPQTITLRHILTHSSGIRHYTGGNEGEIYDHYTTAKAIGLFSGSNLLFEPGSKASYSTHAFTVAARAVETASGTDFPTAMQKLVYGPAGTKDLAIEDLTKPAPANRSMIYNRVGEKGTLPYTKWQDGSWKYGGGGMESSARSLVTFGDAVLHGKILKSATVNQMWTPQVLKDGTKNYGLGWVVSADTQTVRHSGSQQGSRTSLVIHRPTGIVICVLCNTSNSPITEIDDPILKVWIDAHNN